jgi:hypothetical protein
LRVVDRFYQGFVCSTGSSGPDVGQTPVPCYAAAVYGFARVRVEPRWSAEVRVGVGWSEGRFLGARWARYLAARVMT